eukprot:scaffold104645_cov53-Attheya_sp.AAC.1
MGNDVFSEMIEIEGGSTKDRLHKEGEETLTSASYSIDIKTDKREGTALENSESQSKPLGSMATSVRTTSWSRIFVKILIQEMAEARAI